MTRTTLKLAPAIHRRLKQQAAAEGISFQDLVNRTLRNATAAQPTPPAYQLEWVTWDAKLQPGVDILDRDSLFDILDGRR